MCVPSIVKINDFDEYYNWIYNQVMAQVDSLSDCSKFKDWT